MPDPTTFLAQAAGRGATVVVLGSATPALRAALAIAAGPTGLVVLVLPAAAVADRGSHGPSSPDGAVAEPPTGHDGVHQLRGAPTAVPVLSHAADLLVLTDAAEDDDADAVAAEARRLLAPGGVLRAVAPLAAAYRLVGTLHAAAFRDVEAVQLGGITGVRARGPREPTY